MPTCAWTRRRSSRKSAGSRLRGTLGWFWTVLGPFFGLLLIAGLFAWLTRDSGSFVSAYNWRTIAVQTVIVGTAALGMTLVMIAGGIDLSVGSAMALVTVVVALLVRDYHWPVLVALGAGVLLGGGCGLLNGSSISGVGGGAIHHHVGESGRSSVGWRSGSRTARRSISPAPAKARWFHEVMAVEMRPGASVGSRASRDAAVKSSES